MGLLAHGPVREGLPREVRGASIRDAGEEDHRAGHGLNPEPEDYWIYVSASRLGSLHRSELRVCPETSDRIAKFSQHEPDRSEAQERERYAVEVLPILGESSAAVEPRKRA